VAAGKRFTPSIKGCHAGGYSRKTQTHDTLHISLLKPMATLHLLAKLGGRSFSFLIDTGAAVSLLSTHTWELVQSTSQVNPLKPWTSTRLVGVNGSPIQVKGTTTIHITLNGHILQISVVVVHNLNEDAILGLDFLSNHHCIIDTSKNLLHFQKNNFSVPLQSEQNIEPSISAAHLVTTTVVPPKSEMEVLAYMNHPSSNTWLAENNLQNGVTVARALVKPMNAHIVLRLLNVTEEAVTIHKNTKLAVLENLPDTSVSAIDAVPEKHTNHVTTCNSSNHLRFRKVIEEADGLTNEQRSRLVSLLTAYADIFAGDNTDLGRTSKIQHSIHTGDAPPIRQPPRRIPVHQRQQVTELVDDRLKNDIIERSTSPWSSPIVLVRKKDGSMRFCVDYRKINSITKKDAYPIPRIDDTLDTLAGSIWFTTLDLLTGYWQIEVNQNDKEKTAFTTRDGLFQFKVMPFGLCN
jgi:hypothetical protein